MKRVSRDRIVSGLIAVLVLGGAAACSMSEVQPSAGSRAGLSDADHCVRTGGMWRNGVCDTGGAGGGGY
jgi:hypothetical protein